MKKVFFKLPAWWIAETPILARFFQLISSAIAALPLYYAALPIEFKTALPDYYLMYSYRNGMEMACLYIPQALIIKHYIRPPLEFPQNLIDCSVSVAEGIKAIVVNGCSDFEPQLE